MAVNRLVILSVVLMVSLVLGTVKVLSYSPVTVQARIYFMPWYYHVGSRVPDPWIVAIELKEHHVASKEIDPETILLEGIYAPGYLKDQNRYHYPYKLFFILVVPFDGHDVLDAALAKLGHMAIEPGNHEAYVYLKISGRLLPQYGSTAFEGSGKVTLDFHY